MRAGSPGSDSTTPRRCSRCPAAPTTTSWWSGRSQSRGPVELTAAELRDQVARARAGLVRLGVAARRPGGGVPAQRARGPGAAARHREPRRGVLVLRAGVRHPQRRRPVGPDRAGRAGRRRRLPLRRQGRSTGRGEVAAIRRSLPSVRHTVLRAVPRPGRTAADRRLDVVGPGGRARRAGLRPGAVRPPAVRPVLLGHDRAAQADRARPRRHHPRAPQGARAADGPRAGRPVLLVLHHRLDDVELPGLRPRRRRHRGALRRQPGRARPGGAVAARRRDRRHVLRHQRPVPAGLPQAGAACRGRSPTCRPCAGSAPPARRCPPRASAGSTTRCRPDLVLSSFSGGTDVCTRLRRRQPAAAGPRRPDRRPLPRLPRWRRTTPTAARWSGEQGELVITAPMPSMPVGFWGDDDGSRYRAAYFEDFPGVWRHGDWITIDADGSCVLSGRSDATLNRGRRAARHRGVLLGGRGDAGGGRQPGGAPRGRRGRRRRAAAVRRARRGRRGRRRDLERAIARELRTHLSPRHVPDAVHAVPALPRTLSGKKLEVPVKRILRGAAGRRRRGQGCAGQPRVAGRLRALRPPLNPTCHRQNAVYGGVAVTGRGVSGRRRPARRSGWR